MIGIVYSTNSKMIRRIVVPDNDRELQQRLTRDGETLLIADVPTDNASVRAAVQQATGVRPPVLVCAVVDDRNLVERLVVADPEIDNTFTNRTLVDAYSPEIDVNCVYNRANNTFTVPARTEPAYRDKEDNLVPARQVPAKELTR